MLDGNSLLPSSTSQTVFWNLTWFYAASGFRVVIADSPSVQNPQKICDMPFSVHSCMNCVIKRPRKQGWTKLIAWKKVDWEKWISKQTIIVMLRYTKILTDKNVRRCDSHLISLLCDRYTTDQKNSSESDSFAQCNKLCVNLSGQLTSRCKDECKKRMRRIQKFLNIAINVISVDGLQTWMIGSA